MILYLFLPVIVTGLMFYSTSLGEEKKPVVKGGSNVVPTIYDHLFQQVARDFSLDWKMLKRISWVESNTGKAKSVAIGLREPANVSDSVSFDGKSWGIMQVTLTTAKEYDKSATAQKLNDPLYSITISAKHFSFLKRNYPTFTERDLVMSYNHGQGNQLNFIKKEKSGTLLVTEYLAGRDYWNKYLKAKTLIP